MNARGGQAMDTEQRGLNRAHAKVSSHRAVCKPDPVLLGRASSVSTKVPMSFGCHWTPAIAVLEVPKAVEPRCLVFQSHFQGV